ncbi:hypothetical protein N7492_002140 [Penicillium capsulatum]|uniref:BTB domain-containing protein n=1 Tax=Penicillium capsulatum TaxID=69766 RepID=A0A9W9LVE2_9EURO|nr:hypothetical protein N7492_002140 [Penicillium capsulatum]KAJ6123248.1 hypothetical protein N7512_005713 [Penicillium capsulatum]
MDTPEVRVPGSENPDQDSAQDAMASNASGEVVMGGTQDPQDPEAAGDSLNPTQAEVVALRDAQEEPAPALKNPGLSFLDFMTSPIVEIVVGQAEHQTVLKAHEALLLESPFLSEYIEKFEASGPRRISLPEENKETVTCFLQFQYTRDYTILEGDSTHVSEGFDESGQLLLRHARVYTLAEKLGLPRLKSLAHKKIHQVEAKPAGELAYARYVYTHTSAEDTRIREPIAAYWAARSHVLRHSIEGDFERMCLEVPQFTFDMLTMMLDRREKDDPEVHSSVRGSARKRRQSEK